MKYDHIGLVAHHKKDGEEWVDFTKVWVTDAAKHPYRVEWFRYEPDSPVNSKVREESHIAFEVEDLEEASKGLKVLYGPIEVEGYKIGFYEYNDGSIIEFLVYPEKNKK